MSQQQPCCRAPGGQRATAGAAASGGWRPLPPLSSGPPLPAPPMPTCAPLPPQSRASWPCPAHPGPRCAVLLSAPPVRTRGCAGGWCGRAGSTTEAGAAARHSRWWSPRVLRAAPWRARAGGRPARGPAGMDGRVQGSCQPTVRRWPGGGGWRPARGGDFQSSSSSSAAAHFALRDEAAKPSVHKANRGKQSLGGQLPKHNTQQRLRGCRAWSVQSGDIVKQGLDAKP